MDDTTRDTYAILNAYRFLLEAIYLELLGSSVESIERMRSFALKRIDDPYILPHHNPHAMEETFEIRPKTAEIVEGFFRSLYPPDRTDSRALPSPKSGDDSDPDKFPF